MAETTRLVGSQATVSLREIIRATVWSICDLKTTPEQERFCGPNVDSLIEALFEPRAWFRAIYADETPVGFLMLARDTNAGGPLEAPTGEHFLWRLMIAAEYQGQSYGQRALQQLIAHVRTLPGATSLLTSCGLGEGSPLAFYHRLGFVETGDMLDEEVVLHLPLTESTPYIEGQSPSG